MNDPHEQAINLANQAQAFLSSELGQHIAKMSGDVIDSCTEALKTVDPEDTKEIRRLQNEIRRHETLAPLIMEVIHLGLEAKQQSAEED